MTEPVRAMEERIKVREVTGVFHSRDALEAAVGALLENGFDRADIEIMAGADAIVEKLGGIYAPTEELADVPEAPRRFFRAREDVTVPLAGAAGILTYIGATARRSAWSHLAARWPRPWLPPRRGVLLPAASAP